MAKKSVRDLDVAGRRVLIRADLNVPLADAGGKSTPHSVSDDRRIRSFLPTLDLVTSRGGRAIVMSHLGRPVGDAAKDAAFSLRPVARRMEELTRKKIAFVPDCVGPSAQAAADALKDGECALLENLRFHPAETIIDKARKNPDRKLTPEQDESRRQFAGQLASLGQCYVNDAFGTCHRKHVSMYDVPRLLLPGTRAMGLLVERELEFLGQALQSPKRPFVAVLGGAKVSDKIGVIQHLLSRVDEFLIGGAMAYTFLAAQGKGVGRSLCEQDKLDLARTLLEQAGRKLVLPVDSVCAAELKAGAAVQTVTAEIPPGLMGLDIGPRTIARFAESLRGAKTIVWNGPMGAFEAAPFDAGTKAVAMLIAEATARGAISVIGGGDSAAAVDQAGLAERMTHISTGGGASLEFLEGRRFEPIEVLDEA